MKIAFSGSKEINSQISDVRNFLKDPASVASCIPDTDGFSQSGQSEFIVKVGMTIGGLRGTFDLKASISEQPGGQITFDIGGGGIYGTVKISLAIILKDMGSNTTMDWNATMELNGIVSGLGEDLLRRFSEEKIGAILANMKSNVEKKAAQAK